MKRFLKSWTLAAILMAALASVLARVLRPRPVD